MTENERTLAFLGDLSTRLSTGEIDLPPCPQIESGIRVVLEREDASADQLARVVISDPILTGRIFNVANSAMNSRSGSPTTDLVAAICRIGFAMVKTLAFELALDKAFELRAGSRLRELNLSIRNHSRRVGVMALFISKRFAPSLKPDDAMLAGLLHEVGKLYILARADKYPELFGNPSTLGDVLESWNPGVGQAILDAWNLPEAVVNAVGEQGGIDLSPYAPMTIAAVLMVATTLCNLCKVDEAADPYEIMQLPTLRRLHLDVAICQILIEDSCALLKSLG